MARKGKGTRSALSRMVFVPDDQASLEAIRECRKKHKGQAFSACTFGIGVGKLMRSIKGSASECRTYRKKHQAACLDGAEAYLTKAPWRLDGRKKKR